MVQPAALTPEAAAAWLRASAAFRAPKVVELIAGGRMAFNVTRNHYLVLRDLGLLEFPAALHDCGVGRDPAARKHTLERQGKAPGHSARLGNRALAYQFRPAATFALAKGLALVPGKELVLTV